MSSEPERPAGQAAGAARVEEATPHTATPKRRVPTWLVIAVPVLLVALVAGGYLLLRQYNYHGTLYDPPQFAGDFSLTDQNGQPFRLSDQTGKHVVIFFGYTMCPDVCPATLAKWVKTYRDLGLSADRVRFVLITVDPERDTQAQLKAYIDGINPGFVALWGARSDLEPVWKDYWVSVERQQSSSQAGYLVSHSTYTYLLDETGKVEVLYGFDVTADGLTSDLRHLLR